MIALLLTLLAPSTAGVVPRPLAVLDDRDQRQELRAGGVPTIVLPVFTRCLGTCPVTAHRLNDALAPGSFRVVVLSFDSHDTAAGLRDFRARLGLPADWLAWRSIDDAATRAYFDDLDFHFMKADGSFDHPDETFVFSPRGVWAATFTGSDFTGGELASARRRALAADDPRASSRLRQWLLRPEALIAAACAGLAVSLAALLLAVRRPERFK